MTVALLDVNVLVALAWPTHIHHVAAHEWFESNHREGWATCPLTQSGFVRLSSNPRLTPDARSPQEAIELLRRILSLAHHEFWPDETAFGTSPWVATEKLVGFRQVTDAHLLAIALAHRGRLASFDRGLPSLLPANADSSAIDLLVPHPS